jgi:DNA transposition AAA+ family ATPase
MVTNDTEILEPEDGIEPSAPGSEQPVATARSYINVPADTVLLSTQDLAEEQKNLVRWLFGFCKQKNWSWQTAAAETKISDTVLWRIWSDKYRYPLGIWVERKDKETGEKTRVQIDHPRAGQRIALTKVCERIERFKNLALEREDNSNAEVVLTTTIQSVYIVCKDALVTRTVSFIYGNNQLGKSKGLEYFKSKNNHGQTKLIRIPAIGSFIVFIKEVAEQCQVSDEGSGERIRRRILDSVDDSMLLIFDEINLVFQFYRESDVMKVMEFIREIHDLKKCGVVLCGDNDFRDAFVKGTHARLLRKLANRSDVPLQIPDIAPWSDLNLLAAAHGLPPIPKKSEVAAAIDLINKESGIGKYCKLLARTKRKANKKKEKITWDHFHDAWKLPAKMRNGLRDDPGRDDAINI